jgi:hypothetical protein
MVNLAVKGASKCKKLERIDNARPDRKRRTVEPVGGRGAWREWQGQWQWQSNCGFGRLGAAFEGCLEG